MTGVSTPISSWGRLSRAQHQAVAFYDRSQLNEVVRASQLPGLVYGNGRSYGDECLNSEGTIWISRGLDKFISFDTATGVMDCEAGVLLKDIIDIALVHGWFPPVVPGTQFVTMGGAIANDIHGKSHHVSGSFGNHLIEFGLLRTDGSYMRCSREANSDWFAATVGGLGLTGVITDARIRLRRVEGPWLQTETIPFESLESFFELSGLARGQFDYAVAWIDSLGGGTGRGIFFQGEHSARPDHPPPKRSRRLFFTPPVSLVNSLSLKVFNGLYRLIHKTGRRAREQHYLPFFFPLDNVLEWNRMYGPRGFYQYQSVVPESVAHDATREMLCEISSSGLGSFLAVLKTFGELVSPGMLSFPMAGTTLALDFPNKGEATKRLFTRLDSIVLDAGGRLYSAKDARMSSQMFATGYPRLTEFLRYRDPGISSSMSRRLFGS